MNACSDGMSTTQVTNSEWSYDACGVLEQIVSVSQCPAYAPSCGNYVLPSASTAIGDVCSIVRMGKKEEKEKDPRGETLIW